MSAKEVKVSLIGLGIMGSRMAKNLLKNGVQLTVYNRSEESMAPLQKLGARAATSYREAVTDADIVITMLARPEAVEAVILEDALTAMTAGSLWVDCSTVSPAFSKRSAEAAAKYGIRFLDAPVAGTLPQAEQAELVFFVGGRQEDLQPAEQFFQYMGQKILHIGGHSKGSSFKMLVNAMLAQSMVAFAETLLLGEKMGLDKTFLLNILPNLAVSAPFTKAKAEMIRSGQYNVMFPLELMHKDLHLVTLTAYQHGQPLFLANLAKELFAGAEAAGLGREDFAAVYAYLAS
ncbi:MAG: NAD(P)-dependent oxidoreductase [Saprospiraceae bacterium]|nr:NAD(P)-dependent oxidoreductase [Lewinella sp.]